MLYDQEWEGCKGMISDDDIEDGNVDDDDDDDDVPNDPLSL